MCLPYTIPASTFIIDKYKENNLTTFIDMILSAQIKCEQVNLSKVKSAIFNENGQLIITVE